MRVRKRIRIKIEDESRLHDIFSMSVSRSGIILAALTFFLISIGLGIMIVMATPLKTLLPGYLKKSERIATTSGILRLDSLKEQFSDNQAYIDNLLKITDISREPDDSLSYSRQLPAGLSSDSLPRASAKEKEFVSMMRRRERYNISVLAPLAADGIMFVPPVENAVFLESSKGDYTAELAVSPTAPVGAIADGTVLAAYYSPSEGGFAVIIQHERGFISRYAHLGMPAVDVGDIVYAAQAIAAPNSSQGRDRASITLRIWHNGQPLRPFDYIGTSSPSIVNQSL